MLADIVTSDGGEQVFKGCFGILGKQPVLRIFIDGVNATHPQNLEFAIQPFTSDLNVDVALMNFEIAAYLTTRRGGTREIEPVARRVSGAVGEDIDDITASQFVIQRHQAGHEALTITTAAFGGDTRARALIPDLGVYAVGKIERGRADGQIFD